MKNSTGETYIGNWKKGKKHGQGTWTNEDGDEYVGKWRNDK